MRWVVRDRFDGGIRGKNREFGVGGTRDGEDGEGDLRRVEEVYGG